MTQASMDSAFEAKRSIPVYSSKLGRGTVLVNGLYPNITYGYKKFREYCVGHTTVNGIDLPMKLCEGSRKVFLTRLMKGNAAPQPTCEKLPT